MNTIGQQIEDITRELPEGVRLVAVSKYHPADSIREAYESGQRVFGESHALEMKDKHEMLPKDIRWHFIGHLQTNKVKYIIPYVDLIHSVDSVKLLREIDKQAAKVGRTVRCLLQLHIAQEETKFGFTPEECMAFLKEGEWKQMTHVRLCGIMCMASNVDDTVQIRNEFHRAQLFYIKVKEMFFAQEEDFRECSWGMSDDYPIAIEEGSTLIRVGSKIFGAREY
ncbi:MAG: YggS family pyridoxal phosphate-dependent enzyme [Paraprevotella sp.]|nr:YggS family pyridoxal phosphate-dependent enzyme [Paraprevotella sp.]MBP3472124.1 YggS family pyridoxal phosphate-dependent enzyme [Paraprevotella sp.]